jgi:hypothetical protein
MSKALILVGSSCLFLIIGIVLWFFVFSKSDNEIEKDTGKIETPDTNEAPPTEKKETFYIDTSGKKHTFTITKSPQTFNIKKMSIYAPNKQLKITWGDIPRYYKAEQSIILENIPNPVIIQEVDKMPVFADSIIDYDFSGHDIKCFDNIPNEYTTKCRDLCENDKNCAGYIVADKKKCCYKPLKSFQTDGQHKPNRNFKTYVKNSILKDYHKLEKKDHGGNDIKQLTHFKNNIPALRATCSARPDCVGFNNEGWLKKKLNEKANDWQGNFYKQL